MKERFIGVLQIGLPLIMSRNSRLINVFAEPVYFNRRNTPKPENTSPNYIPRRLLNTTTLGRTIIANATNRVG